MNSWNMWAYDKHGIFFHVEARRAITELYNYNYPLVQVEVVEDPQGPYYGWFSKENPDTPGMIWASKHAFGMCFYAGPERSEKEGLGKIGRFAIRSLASSTT